MKLHQTAGGVVFDPDMKKVYLIHKIERDEWLLPKGHIEDGETIVGAAKREVYEETGFSHFVVLGNEPIVKNQFVFEKDGEKQEKVIYIFSVVLTSLQKEDTKEQEKEGLEGKWFDLDEAIKIASHEDIVDALNKAYEQITNLARNI
jgi:8-oxo-dGTP pyrophosphatase MutT (NUDIX family)